VGGPVYRRRIDTRRIRRMWNMSRSKWTLCFGSVRSPDAGDLYMLPRSTGRRSGPRDARSRRIAGLLPGYHESVWVTLLVPLVHIYAGTRNFVFHGLHFRIDSERTMFVASTSASTKSCNLRAASHDIILAAQTANRPTCIWNTPHRDIFAGAGCNHQASVERPLTSPGCEKICQSNNQSPSTVRCLPS